MTEQEPLPKSKNDLEPIDDLEPIPVGMTRREYWRRLSKKAHPSDASPDEAGLEMPQFTGDEGEVPSEEFDEVGSTPAEGVPEPVAKPLWTSLHLPKLTWPRLKLAPAFWTITGTLSLIINIILISIVISLGSQVFAIKTALQDQLIGGLYKNFQLMDQAHIKTTIPISTTVPAKFDLAVETETNVILKKDTSIKRARVTLTTGGLSITNAPADIILPAGTELPIKLSITVPVDQQIPVNLNVNVDIPLEQTELHSPLVGLQNVVGPYYKLLQAGPATLEETVCGKDSSDFCKWLIP